MWLPAAWYVGLSRNSVVLTVVMGQDPPVQKPEEKGLKTFFLQEMKEEQEGHFFRIPTMGIGGPPVSRCPQETRSSSWNSTIKGHWSQIREGTGKHWGP